MPTGFRGNHAVRYLVPVDSALTSAREIHRQSPFASLSNRAVPPPALPARTNHRPPHPPSTARSGGHTTGSGNSSNIVASQSRYGSLSQRILAVDGAASANLQSIARELNSLCSTSYNMPRTNPRITSVLSRVTNSRARFLAPTRNKATEIRSLARGITNIS